jgi:hypothetical protein
LAITYVWIKQEPKMSRLDESRPFIPLNIAVLTVSDTRKPEDDRSGNTLVDRLEKAGHTLADRKIVQDDVPAIQAIAKDWISTRRRRRDHLHRRYGLYRPGRYT